MATVGYARVSSSGQDLALQWDALTALGADRIFTEKASGVLRDRPELAAALDYLRQGDTLAVYSLSRLGRSIPHLIEVVESLDQRGIAFRCVVESFDTSTASGRLVFHLFAMLAQFERDLIRERAAAGRQAAKDRGRTGGRPKVVTPDRLAAAKSLIAADHTVKAAAAAVNVSRASLYRALEAERAAMAAL